MSIASDVLAGWEPGSFTAAGITHSTYRKGQGPGVVVVHEIPGITPLVAKFADEVVDAGFTVVMPSLLGTPGKEPSGAYIAQSALRLCIAREFTKLALRQTSPVIAWLRALARNLHAEVGGSGVGAVGMCYSGGFALGMMVDDIMVAPVLSQPSLPRTDSGLPARRTSACHRTMPRRWPNGRRRDVRCSGLRFTGDRMVGDRFESLRELLGDAFIAIELPSSQPSDHSVLTEQRDEASVRRVIEFFQEKLIG